METFELSPDGRKAIEMSGPLDGCRAKIARAKEHFEAFEQDLRTFCDPKHSTLVCETKEHPTHNIYDFWIKDVPSTRWGLMIGDCIHNARSVLDHITWTLANIS